MVFLYSLILLVINLAVGWFMLYPLKVFLFYPKKQLHLFKKPVPLTPGFLIKKKQWLLNKIESLLNTYLAAASNPKNRESNIAKWEDKVYNWAFKTFNIENKISFIPKFIKKRFQHYASLTTLEVAKQFLRDFVPFLLNKYNVASYIDLLDKKLDIKLIEEYFNKYVYKWLRLLCTALWAIAGLFNMFLFWFLG